MERAASTAQAVVQALRDGDRPRSSASNGPTDWTPTTNQIAQLWARMTRLYGHRWPSAYGDRDDGTWRAGLRGLTGEQLARGLRAVVQAGDAWPPSLPEFRALCTGRPVDGTDGAAVAASMPVSRALPEPADVREARLERGRQALREIRVKLGHRRGA